MLDIDSSEAVFAFTNEDTENIHPGDYKWSLRVVLNAVMENGEVVGGSEVHTPFSFKGCKGGLPTIKI